jgi:hypothetical protein
MNAPDRLAHVRVSGDAGVVDLVAELLRGVFNVAEESADYASCREPGVRRYLTVLLAGPAAGKPGEEVRRG